MGWPRHSCMALDGTIFCSSQPLNAFPREKPQTYKQYHENIYLVNTSLSFPPSLPDSLNFNSFFSLASHPAFFFFLMQPLSHLPKHPRFYLDPKFLLKIKIVNIQHLLSILPASISEVLHLKLFSAAR